METMANRISIALAAKGGNQSELARYVGVTPQAVQKWVAGDSEPKGKNLERVAEFLGVPAPLLKYGNRAVSTASGAGETNLPSLVGGTIDRRRSGRRAADFHLLSAADATMPVERIEYWDARGSCGGGFLNGDQMPKGHLVKEETFFQRYNLKPENAFAIYADGDSMADFIVDGDIVIFDKSKTEPRSGKIFAIEHPDGLRIKVLRRAIDGSWVLESKNPDKRLYPDEPIPVGRDDLLKILGEFVYRQGG